MVDNELTLNDGIKYLSNVDVVMKLRCGCQHLATAVKAGDNELTFVDGIKPTKPNQTCQTKPNIPYHTYQTKPTKPNLPNQTYPTKTTQPNPPN